MHVDTYRLMHTYMHIPTHGLFCPAPRGQPAPEPPDSSGVAPPSAGPFRERPTQVMPAGSPARVGSTGGFPGTRRVRRIRRRRAARQRPGSHLGPFWVLADPIRILPPPPLLTPTPWSRRTDPSATAPGTPRDPPPPAPATATMSGLPRAGLEGTFLFNLIA